jgi:carbamoyltransferase
MRSVLGISAFYHDSAAALVMDGKIVAAAQEERFTRVKHDEAYPRNAVDYVLTEAGLTLAQVDRVVFYDKPFLKFERLLETYVSFAPRGFRSFATAIPVWLREKLFQKTMLLDELEQHAGGLGGKAKLLFSEHHLSHAASAFFPSPFDDDGVHRARQSPDGPEGDRLPPLARAAVLGADLLPRLQGE